MNKLSIKGKTVGRKTNKRTRAGSPVYTATSDIVTRRKNLPLLDEAVSPVNVSEISSDRTEVRIAQLPIEEDTLYTEQFKGLSADGAVLRYDGLSLKFPDEEGGGEKKNFDVLTEEEDIITKDLINTIETRYKQLGGNPITLKLREYTPSKNGQSNQYED